MSDRCYHCNLPIPKAGLVSVRIQDRNQDFCCAGCASVCQTIHESGLGAFYDKQSTSLLPAVDLQYPLEFYDSDMFQKSYLEVSSSGTKTMTLISDTIHCAACVWLIERALGSMQGIIWARVNLTDKRIRINWDDKQAQLSSIMQTLASLGYAAMPYEQNRVELAQQKKNKAMLYRVGFAAFTMMNLMWISIALYTGASDGKYHGYFQWLGFALATPTLFYSGYPFLRSAYFGIRNRYMNMDVPISIGALVTYFYSTYVLFGFSAKGEVYFDTVVNFIFVILIGRYLEASSKKSAISASSGLQQLQPKIALVKKGNEALITPIDAVCVDDIVFIKPGERIAVDGVVVSGASAVDESLLSGESLPVNKEIDDEVFAGTLNTNGSLEVQVKQTQKQTMLSQIVDLVENTRADKGRIVCTIDRIIPYFVWTTLTLATFTFIYWSGVDFDLALLSATSVLIITCPCAFGLATPMSIAVASGSAAKRHILIKNGDALEALNQVSHVVFDKTGTLTLGKPKVDQVYSQIDHQDLLQIMGAIEKHSEHPLARAIVERATQANAISHATDFESTPGLGVSALVDNQRYWVGSLRYLKDRNTNSLVEQARTLEQQGYSCVFCADEQNLLGFVTLSDPIKADAIAVVEQLHRWGKQVTMLSGDSRQVAHAVAQKVNIDQVVAGVLPGDKAAHIRHLQQNGNVLMIGDGVNDAPALIQADVSIALGSGADISAASADVVILKSKLMSIIEAIKLANRTQLVIKQNIIFALSYNAIMVPLAMMAKVTPLFAAIVMPISSLIVIANATRIRKK